MAHKAKIVRQGRVQSEQQSPSATLEGGALPPKVKTTSVLRRVALPPEVYYGKVHGGEGESCAFQPPTTSPTLFVEDVSGRLHALGPGDRCLPTPGHPEDSTSLVGG